MIRKLLSLERRYLANNYNSLPVILSKGKGVNVWDVNGKKYLDFLSSYSANNHGHCHPELVRTMQKQCEKLTLTSRAFHNDKLWEFGELMTYTFNYDKVLPMNTGVEAGETAVKIARKWGYEVKGVAQDQAIVLFPSNNFWGRTISASGTQNEKESYHNFGPFPPNLNIVAYNNIKMLEKEFQNPNVVAYFMEPIQGEAGVNIPDYGYLRKVRELCNKYNVLMIVDEVQTGMGRTGKLLATDYEYIEKPDILILGKALSGGMMPVSAVLADDNVMDVITPGTHGSTFGGNPLGCSIAIKSIDILFNEDMIENSSKMGAYLRRNLMEIANRYTSITKVRGKGLMIGLEIIDDFTAQDIVSELAEKGILCKLTRGNIIRLSPPLIITRKNIDEFLYKLCSILNKRKDLLL